MSGHRRFTVDLAPDDQRPPWPGDILVTARTVNCVIDSREVESRAWCNRWAVTLTHIRERTPEERRSGGCTTAPVGPSGRTFMTTRYRRGEGPADWFAATEPATGG